MNVGTRMIRSPRGPALSCKGWPQEAALRMLMNNLDPDVAERPDDLVVYGGSGKAARNWQAYDAIVDTLRRLDHDETLLIQSGKPVGVFKTHTYAPRVLIANALLVPAWATWETFRGSRTRTEDVWQRPREAGFTSEHRGFCRNLRDLSCRAPAIWRAALRPHRATAARGMGGAQQLAATMNAAWRGGGSRRRSIARRPRRSMSTNRDTMLPLQN